MADRPISRGFRSRHQIEENQKLRLPPGQPIAAHATNPQKTTSTDYTTDCQSCHVPARQSDWIYTYGYPVLSR